jgi:hypothetical protein
MKKYRRRARSATRPDDQVDNIIVPNSLYFLCM